MTITVRKATPGDIPAILDVGGAAFGDNDPVNLALFSKEARASPEWNDDDRKWRTLLSMAKMSNPGHHVVVAVDGDKIVGSASWEPPAMGTPGPTPEQKAQAMQQLMQAAPKTLNIQAFMGTGEFAQRFVGANLGEKALDMWGLEIIAVDPACQRKGVGSMLMKYGLDLAETDKKGAVLIGQGDGGMKFYEANGFKCVAQDELFGDTKYLFVKEAPA